MATGSDGGDLSGRRRPSSLSSRFWLREGEKVESLDLSPHFFFGVCGFSVVCVGVCERS